MMHTWFECKIRYEKVMENGMNKKVTEPYLVDALSFTEAEARIIEEITPYISGEFTVSTSNAPTTANCSPLKKMQPTAGLSASCSSLRWTKKRSREKTSTTVLVQASDLRDAVKKLDEGMKGTMADYVIASVAETAIMDVYPYEAEPDVKPEFPDAGKTE